METAGITRGYDDPDPICAQEGTVRADDIEEFALPFALGAGCATHIFAQEATIVAAVAVGFFAFGGCFLGVRLASVVHALVRRAIGRREP